MAQDTGSAVLDAPSNSQIVDQLLGSGEFQLEPATPQVTEQTAPSEPAASEPATAPPVTPEPTPPVETPSNLVRLLARGGKEVDITTPQGREEVGRLDETARYWQSEAQKWEAQAKRGDQPRDETGRFAPQAAPQPDQPSVITADTVNQARNALIQAHADDPYGEKFLQATLAYQETLADFKNQQTRADLEKRLPPEYVMAEVHKNFLTPEEIKTADFVADTYGSEVPREIIGHTYRSIMADLNQQISEGRMKPDNTPFTWADVNAGKLNRMVHEKSVAAYAAKQTAAPQNSNPSPVEAPKAPEVVSKPGTTLTSNAPPSIPTGPTRPNTTTGVNGGTPPNQNPQAIETYKLVDAVLKRVSRG